MELWYTKHAKQRMRDRGFSPTRLEQQMSVVPFEPTDEPVRWDMPNVNLFVAYQDVLIGNKEVRRIFTISMRYVNATEKEQIKEQKTENRRKLNEMAYNQMRRK